MPTSLTEIESKSPLMFRLAKVFTDPLRMKILAECNMRAMSPKMFFNEFGGGNISRVSRAFDVLVEHGWLEQTETKTGGRRRGGVEHFYEATQSAFFDEELWPEVPDSMKGLVSWRIIETFLRQAMEAMEAGTMDARVDRHLSWMPLRLDQRGWEILIAKLDALFYWLFQEQARVNKRIGKTGEEPIPVSVALMCFESPKETAKQP